MNSGLLARIEDACLNASATPRQRWLDGWLLRLAAGKAKRARCIHALAPASRPLPDKLLECEAVYREAGLPMIFRITPFSQPAALDAELDALGYASEDATSVMVCTDPASAVERATARPLPADWQWRELAPADYAATVGAWRGTPDEAVRAHVERLRWSPVPFAAMACFDAHGTVLAGGQAALEGGPGGVVGLYDIFTAPEARGRGLATAVCAALLQPALASGAALAYLQVEVDNISAKSVYQHLGFANAYGYHYRMRPADRP